MENNLLPPEMPTTWVPPTSVVLKPILSGWLEKRRKPPEPIDWVVDKMCASGDITMLVADGGVGKTWKAAHIAMRVAMGRFVDDVFRTKKGNVVWFDNENGPDENDRRCRILDRESEGLLEATMPPHNVYFFEDGWKADEHGFKLLQEYINEHHPVLVIFDCLVSFLPEQKEESSSNDMRGILDGINRILKFDDIGKPREKGTAPAALILHHSTKAGGGNAGRGGSDDGWPTFRGSGDIKNAASFMVVMKKDSFKKKDGSDESRIKMKWVKARRGRAEEGVYAYSLIDHGVEDTPEHWIEYRCHGKDRGYDDYLQTKIDEALGVGEAVTAKELGERIESLAKGKTDLQNKVKELVEKGLISVATPQKGNVAATYVKKVAFVPELSGKDEPF